MILQRSAPKYRGVLLLRKDETMKRSCRYCGKIHDRLQPCPSKPAKPKVRYEKYSNDKDIFRGSKLWKAKRREIIQRDLGLCQLCKRGVYLDSPQLTAADGVHHIISLEADFGKRLDNDNLISLCSFHHELAEKGIISVKIQRSAAVAQEEENKTSYY